jgi:hypothetical protein
MDCMSEVVLILKFIHHTLSPNRCAHKKKRKRKSKSSKKCDESNSHFIHTTHLYCIFKQIFNSQLSIGNQIEDANHFYSSSFVELKIKLIDMNNDHLCAPTSGATLINILFMFYR